MTTALPSAPRRPARAPASLWRRLARSRRARRLGQLALTAAAILVVVAAAGRWAMEVLPLPERLAERSSTVLRFSDGSVAHVLLAPDGRYRIAVDLEHVDPDFVHALLRFEDKRFHEHGGVDGLAVLRASWLNLRHGKVVSGASTLTMQLVRVLEPRRRTVGSKLVEMLRARQLEHRLSKREILEAYLRFAPYGRNVEGVEAAARSAFGHGAADLSPEEIATLLAIPQKPAARHPSPRNAERLREARDAIAAWLLDRGALPAATAGHEGAATALERIRKSPVPTRLAALPRLAPHATAWLTRELPQGTDERLTLDAGLQRSAESLFGAAREGLARDGIHAGAAVLIEHRTGRVLALVGGLDFWAGGHGAQVPAFDVPRSPGSALKPLIYALAIDRGLALPEQLVPDMPTTWGDYAPGNYDGRWSGLVRLEEALSRSLNLPFVDLLSQLGVEDFLGTLRQAGASSLRREPGWYGLSAAIGAVELSPLELAALYATLANDGRYLPPRILAEQPRPLELRILGDGACWLTRRALELRDRPDFPSRQGVTGLPPDVHWKTGTSYGHRDAWAAGSDGDHSAVVWLGNLDNAPSAALVGSEAAGPLLFDLLALARKPSSLPRYDGPPYDLARVDACALSGRLPSPACDATMVVLAPRAHVPTQRCGLHVLVDVDLETGLALNPGCRAGRAHETRRFVSWPASARRFLVERDGWLPSPPVMAPGCEPEQPRRPPSILSPPAGQVVVLAPHLPPSDQELPFEAESETASARHAWFVDGRLLGTIAPHERLWWTPSAGVHELLVQDETGLSARRRLEVRTAAELAARVGAGGSR